MPDKVVTPQEWIEARKKFLQKEKEHTRAGDALASERRQLPMVKIDKPYTFHGGPDDNNNPTTFTLSDLFGGQEQLLVYHFMFKPEDDRGCAGCSHVGESLPDIRHLQLKNTNLVCVSRAPWEKLEAFRQKAGWDWPWYSSEGSDFNYDFHATIDETVAPVLVNFLNKEEMQARGKQWHTGDVPGFSVFWKKKSSSEEGKEDEIYHTYSTFARGSEPVMPTLALLDMTPLGRQIGMYGPAEFKLGFEYEADAGDQAQGEAQGEK